VKGSIPRGFVCRSRTVFRQYEPYRCGSGHGGVAGVSLIDAGETFETFAVRGHDERPPWSWNFPLGLKSDLLSS
jgi:hypothetical protein